MKTERKLDFTDVKLYAVTLESLSDDEILQKSEALLRGGLDALQLRARNRTDRSLFQLGQKLKSLCDQFGALFIVNNRVDLAVAVDAHGLHLGHEDLPLSQARSMLGHRKIIGASTHSMPQALAAQREGADYVSCGPLWATPTKPEYQPVGPGLIGLYRAALRVPFVAIGSIDRNNVDEVVKAGAERMALVRALFDAQNPEEEARFFKAKIDAGKPATLKA